MKRTTKSALVFVLTAGLVFGNAGTVGAKAKKPKLSKTKVTLTVGKKLKITVKKASPKKTKWSLPKKGKKIVSLSKKKKKSVTIKGKKAGKTTLTAKITVGKKKYTKKVKITVKKKAKPVKTSTTKVTPTPVTTNRPGNNTTPTPGSNGTPTPGNNGTPTPGSDVTPTPGDDATPTPSSGATSTPDDTYPTPAVPTVEPGWSASEMKEIAGLDGKVDANGVMTSNKANQVGVELPNGVKSGDTLTIKVTGAYTGDEDLRSFISNSSWGAVSDVANTATVDGFNKADFAWVYTLTVNADTTPAYILVKGSTPGSPMSGKLVITSVQVKDETTAPTTEPTTEPTPKPDTEVIKPIVVTGQSVTYETLSVSDDYFVNVAGKEVSVTQKDIAQFEKVFDTENVYEKWTASNEIVKTLDNGTVITAISDDENSNNRVVTVNENGTEKTYAVTMEKNVDNSIKATIVKKDADAESVTTIVEVSGDTVKVTRDNVQAATITKNADGSYKVVVDPAWAEEQGLELSKVVKTPPTTEPTAGPVDPTPTASGGAATAEPTTEPTTDPTTEPTTEPTAEPTTEPTTEPTVEPTAGPKTVKLTAANEFAKGSMENLSYDTEKGTATYTATNKYSGGGVAWYINEDKTPIKASDYKTITVRVKASVASSPVVFNLYNSTVKDPDKADTETVYDKFYCTTVAVNDYANYNNTGTSTTEMKDYTFDLSKVKDQNENIYAICFKYNTYNADQAVSDAMPPVTFEFESITFSK